MTHFSHYFYDYVHGAVGSCVAARVGVRRPKPLMAQQFHVLQTAMVAAIFLQSTLTAATSKCGDVATQSNAADCSNGTMAVATCCGSFNMADDAGDGEALQAMLDSGLSTAFVPAIGRPWVINASLHMRSHQTVVLAPGVEIQARKGGYHCNGTGIPRSLRPSKYCQSPTQPCKCHGNLTLFSATDVSHVHLLGFGAILRMHQADYSDPSRYQPAQWRPAVVLAGVTDSSVQGLTIVSTGGDGVSIYAGGSPDQPPTARVLLKDLTIRQAYRNALSVTSARDLLVEGCIFADTCRQHGNFGGPCSGVDMEPDYHHEELSNITFRRCLFQNNRDYGAIISPAGLCGTGCTEPKNISILFDDCSISGGASESSRGLVLNGMPPGITGSIEAKKLLVSNTPGPAVLLANKAAAGARFSCVGCHFDGCAWLQPPDGKVSPHYPGTGAPTAVISMGAVTLKARDNGFPFGGAHFQDCVVDTASASFYTSHGNEPVVAAPPPPLLNFAGGGSSVQDVSGSLQVNGCPIETGSRCCTVNVTGDVSRLSRSCSGAHAVKA